MTAVVAFSLLVIVFNAGGSRLAPDLNLAIPLRSEEGGRVQPVGLLEVASSLGVTLEALHVHRFEEDAVVHVRHPVAPAPAGPPGPSLGSASERDLVRKMLGMSIVAYGKDPPFPEDAMAPIVEARDSWYGPEIDTYAKEAEKEVARQQFWFDALNGTYETIDGGTGVDAAHINSDGVHALEFTVKGVGKVLSFRGSMSKGDFVNNMMWMANLLRQKMSAKMKYAWMVDAGLPWSDELEEDRGRLPRFISQMGVILGSVFNIWGFRKRMRKLAEGTGGLVDPDKVVRTGYWEFTKRIAEAVRERLEPGQDLLFTGHSAGGTRAALSSMYLKRKHGDVYRAVTFASLGGQCASRLFFFTGADLTDDVDIYEYHEQITDYVHPLDLYGLMDYGLGKRCTFGLAGIAESRSKKYCEKLFGHRGPEILLAGKVLDIGSGLLGEFVRCRYFTHSWRAVDSFLGNDTFLNEDGTTDGGCLPVDIIPENDPDGKCPASAGVAEDCSDELSCKSCQVSSSGPCYWLKSSGRCVSHRPLEANTYVAPEDSCPAA